MATISSLKTLAAAAKTSTSDRVTYQEWKNVVDGTLNELVDRGLRFAADTVALQLISRADTANVIVQDNGLYHGSASGVPNGTTVFAALGGGVWIKILGSTASVVNYTGLLQFNTVANIDTAMMNATVPAINSTQKFEFVTLADFSGLPASLSIIVAGIESILLDFPDEYIGTSFRYTHTNGTAYIGTIINGSINF